MEMDTTVQIGAGWSTSRKGNLLNAPSNFLQVGSRNPLSGSSSSTNVSPSQAPKARYLFSLP